MNKLFCYNYFLSSFDGKSSWITEYVKLNNLTKTIQDHNASIMHIRASVVLATFGTVRIETELSDHIRQSITK